MSPIRRGQEYGLVGNGFKQLRAREFLSDTESGMEGWRDVLGDVYALAVLGKERTYFACPFCQNTF
jgi:hypothetical protein